VKYPSNRWVSYEINGANRVKAVRHGKTGNYYRQQATYKPDGSFAGATLGRNDVTWTETRQYNSRLQPCTMQVQKGTQTLLGLQWKHSATDPDGACEGTGTNNNGNIVEERLKYPHSGVEQVIARSYGYDTVNRLNGYSEPTTGKSQYYGYDRFGNLWQSGAAVGVPELRATGSSWYLLDDNTVKNRLAQTTHDAAGNQTQLSTIQGADNAKYDAEGRLVQVAFGSPVANYVYDAEGRRVKRTDGGGTATYYVYDAAGQLMAEYGSTVQATGTQYLATDHLGSTRMVQDAQGNCVSRMDYAPFGAVIARAGQECYGTPWTSGVMFTGKERDEQAGLDYFGARYFSGTLGRFISPDEPLIDQSAADAQSWNLYGYARNNPLRYIDPTGMCSEDGNGGYTDEGSGLFPGKCSEG
jgi:RHS repeat-associated protein